MGYEAKNPVKTTERSLDIVETLKELDGAKLTDLADHLDLPNSTVHNHLSTLVQRGYVVKDGNTYRVSLRFLEFGEYARGLRRVYEFGRPELDELAEETGEVASLMIEENGMGVYLYTVEGENAVPLDTYPGKHIHLHSSALGKAILAHYPADRVDNIIDRHGLPAATDHSIIDREALHDELEGTRERGIAFEDEERVDGYRAVAASIRGETGRIVGAISVSGPTSRLDDNRFENHLPERLLNVTNVIELKLVYS